MGRNVEDLTGKKFGRLLVIQNAGYYVGKTGHRRSQYLCRCDCGKEKIVLSSHLKDGHTTSCGCALTESNHKKLIDLTGQKFGRLTVIKRSEDYVSPHGDVSVSWLCRCDCGNYTEVTSKNLKRGDTLSCGCLIRQKSSERCKNHNPRTTHGHHGERLYFVWRGMKARCENPNNKNYRYYGKLGVNVCEEWHDYAVFREWAYANGYDENAKRGVCTLDRSNPYGNYEPDNCRWADAKTQANNKRNSKRRM